MDYTKKYLVYYSCVSHRTIVFKISLQSQIQMATEDRLYTNLTLTLLFRQFFLCY